MIMEVPKTTPVRQARQSREVKKYDGGHVLNQLSPEDSEARRTPLQQPPGGESAAN